MIPNRKPSDREDTFDEHVHFRAPEDLVDELESLVEHEEYENLSEACRDLLEQAVDTRDV